MLVLAYLAFDYFSYVQERNDFVEKKGVSTTLGLKTEIDDILKKIVLEGNALADLFGSKDLSAEEVENLIKESALKIPEIQGVTACYEPGAFSNDRGLYCPYYNKGTMDYVFVEDSYDYSITGAKGTDWYTSVRDEGAKWVDPYYGAGAQDWYIDYGIPFYFKEGPNKGKVRGTITMSFVCSGFQKLVHSLSLGKTGYGLITSKSGAFLSHPNSNYIGTTNLEEEIKKESDPSFKKVYQAILKGEAGNIAFRSMENKKETLVFYDNIPTSEWMVGLVFFKNDLLSDGHLLNQKYIRLSIIFSLLFIAILAIYYNKDFLDEGEIWRLSILSSMLLMANLFLIGYLQHQVHHKKIESESAPMIDIGTIKSFVDNQVQKATELKVTPPVPVPTGIYIQRMEFEDGYNLNVGGSIWQKYPLNVAETADIGFVLPQMSPFAEAAYIEESYRKTIEAQEDQPGYLLVGFEFRVTLRLNLNYADYPFDKRHLSIELLPKNNNDYLLFTPDLASYNYTNPSQKSGINHNIAISGSQVLESYFNYTLESYDTDFGYGNKALFEKVPVLHFNINLRRVLLNSFVTYLIPIFVTLIMVFILIYACGKTEERQGIIESMAAFFFVLIFSHIDLRKEIVTADLIYMEYFYFTAYFMLILATFNLITYAKDKSAVFDYNNNQIFKALFFPIFLFIILIVTLLKFY